MIFSVIIPTYNGGKLLRACLESVARLNFPSHDFEVIVVDNNSSDDSKDIIEGFPFRYVLEKGTQSSYAARNAGIAVARGEILAFTDSDCEVHPDWLNHVLDAARRNPKAGCIAGEILPFPGTTAIERFSDRIGLLRQRGPLSGWHFKPYAQTANASFRRDVFRRIGLFDGHMKSGGDATFAWRMLGGTDYEIAFAPDAIVYHHHRTDIASLWSQFRRYGGGKVSWMQQEKSYPAPRVSDQEKDLVSALDAALASIQKAGLSEEEFAYPLLSIATKAAHHSGYLQDMLRHVTGEESPEKWPALAAAGAAARGTAAKSCPICGGRDFVPGPNNRLARGNPPCCKVCGSLERHRVLRNLAPILQRRNCAGWNALSVGEAAPQQMLPLAASRVVRSLSDKADGAFDVIFALARLTGTGGDFTREIDYFNDRLSPNGLLTVSYGVGQVTSASAKRGDDQFMLGTDAGCMLARRMPEHNILQASLVDDVTGASIRLVFASRDQRLLDEIAEYAETTGGFSAFAQRKTYPAIVRAAAGGA